MVTNLVTIRVTFMLNEIISMLNEYNNNGVFSIFVTVKLAHLATPTVSILRFH